MPTKLLRSRLGQDLLDSIDATFKEGPFELLMPRWKTSSQLDLSHWLREAGAMPGAYPAIAPEAVMSAAVHAADISVDEEGTVAAAATAVGFAYSGPPTPELIVHAERPFLYVILHRESGLVLFAGQVVEPVD